MDDAHALADLLDSIDFTEYDANELDGLRDMIDEVGSVVDRAADQIDATDFDEGPDA